VQGYQARSKQLHLVPPEDMYGLGPFGGSCCTNWQATWAALGIPGQAFADDPDGKLLDNIPSALGGAHRIYLRGPLTSHGGPIQNCDDNNACCSWCGERCTSSLQGNCSDHVRSCECATRRPSDGVAVLAPVWKYLFTSKAAPGSVLPEQAQLHCCGEKGGARCCSDPTALTGRPQCKM